MSKTNKKSLIDTIKDKVLELGWSWDEINDRIGIGCECEYIFDLMFTVRADTNYIVEDILYFAQRFDVNQACVDCIGTDLLKHPNVFGMISEVESIIKRLVSLASEVNQVILLYNEK